MEFITTQQHLSEIFEKLCYKYDHFEWVVAWAGKPSNIVPGDILKKHFKKKADKIVVGLHFYQTHPDFIERYISCSSFKYIKQVDGTFHPKVYSFYNNDDDWAVLMGSSNLTEAGFNDNTEANILVTSNDANNAFYKNVKKFIEKIWQDASYFDNEELDKYRDLWEKQRKPLSSLQHDPKISEKIAVTTFNLMTWNEYEEYVSSRENYDMRMALLKKAKELFQFSFSELKVEDRKRLAGIPSKEENNDMYVDEENNKITELNWYAFGHMSGNGLFSKAIIHLNESNYFHIANAIDSIPNEGIVTKNDYDKYIKEFMKAFHNAKNPLSTATRLLALKRPDTFVCVDGANKKGLCKKYNIVQNQLTVETYWNLLIERIKKDVWFNENVESDLKKYQVAMLDCIYYD